MLGRVGMKTSLKSVIATREPMSMWQTSCRIRWQTNYDWQFSLSGPRAEYFVLAPPVSSYSSTTSYQFLSWPGARQSCSLLAWRTLGPRPVWHFLKEVAFKTFPQGTKSWSRELWSHLFSASLSMPFSQLPMAMKCSQLHTCRWKQSGDKLRGFNVWEQKFWILHDQTFLFKMITKVSQNPYATPQWMLYLYEISHFLAFLCPALTFYIFCLPDQVP